MNAGELKGASREQLEEIYRSAPVGPLPSGNWRGEWLTWLDTPGAKRWHVRLMDTILFERTRFGIDFDRRLWWFITPAIAAGRFEISTGPSRWRDTETLRLEYGVSKLPIRGVLYDEVKPLSDALCLGLGGVNAGTGQGDHFFFSLVPRALR
jgi:hypothetical protein